MRLCLLVDKRILSPTGRFLSLQLQLQRQQWCSHFAETTWCSAACFCRRGGWMMVCMQKSATLVSQGKALWGCKKPHTKDFLLSGDFKFIFWWYKEQRHCALKVLNLFNFFPSDWCYRYIMHIGDVLHLLSGTLKLNVASSWVPTLNAWRFEISSLKKTWRLRLVVNGTAMGNHATVQLDGSVTWIGNMAGLQELQCSSKFLNLVILASNSRPLMKPNSSKSC